MLKGLYDKMLIDSMRKWKKGLDQALLEKVIWPYVSSENSDINDAVGTKLIVHDSYTCVHFKDKQPPASHRAFPTKRYEDKRQGLNFVGQHIGDSAEKSVSLEEYGTCPMICRPKEHPDWILC